MTKTSTAPPVSKGAEALKKKLTSDKGKIDAIKADLAEVAADYDVALEEVDRVIRAVSRTAEDEFSKVVQGSKGTGLQESHRLITLRQLRLQRGLSLRKLSDEMDIPFPHVSEIERGMRQMTYNEQDIYELWAGGRIYYRMVPYVRLSEET